MSQTINIEQLLEEGKTVKIGKNQVFKDDKLFVVEKYEFTDTNGEDMFSVHDAYENPTVAIKIAATIE